MVEDEQVGMLWQDVDEAERHLLCGNFQKAQGTAAATLMRATSLQKEGVSAALNDVIESCCMVLLQAQHECGRHGELEGQLRKAFPALETIPSEVFLTWSCLRVKAGDKDGAQAAISEYLQTQGKKLDRRASCSLAGLYALELMCDHRQASHEAEDWLHEQTEWLDAATMRLLLKKVRRRQQRCASLPKRPVTAPPKSNILPPPHTPAKATPPPTTALQSTPSLSASFEATRGISRSQTEPYNQTEPPDHQTELPDSEPSRGAVRNSERREHVIASRRGWFSWLGFWAALVRSWWSRGWQSGQMKWRQVSEDAGGRTLLLALSAAVFAYALIKERAALRRHLRNASRTCQRSVADLLELAFSYSLNPLAAAAQLGPQSVRPL